MSEHLIIDSTGRPPKNWLVESVIGLAVTLLTCSCLAIFTAVIGVVYATKVDKHFYMGAQHEAHSNANTAKILFIVTIVLVLCHLFLGVGLTILEEIMDHI